MLGALLLGFGGLVLLKAAFATNPDPRQALAEIMAGNIVSAASDNSPTVIGSASRRRDEPSVPTISPPLRRTGPFEAQ